MVVGEMAEGVDLLVVGGGPGGYAAALRAAQLGREVIVVDRLGMAGLGGVCLHSGCIPSKALIELAEVVHRPKMMEIAGVIPGGIGADLARFQLWKNSVMEDLRAGIEKRLRRHKVRVLQGELAFNKPNRVAVATPDGNVSFLEFASAIVSTGSRPAGLRAFPSDGDRVLDSAQALELSSVPPSLAIIGAGYIGLELGTAFAKLGSRVTIVEMLDRILPELDASVTRPVMRSLERLGVRLLLGTEATGLDDRELIVRSGDIEHLVPADKLVVAVGRLPNTDDLGLGSAGVTVHEDGRVQVDAASRLAARHIAAIGDITAGPALAHKATAEAGVAAEILSGRRARFDPAAIPAVVFADPEVAVVGLSEQQARDEGIDVAIGQFPLAASGRARTLAAPDGLVRVVIDRQNDVVVGVQMVGPHVSELAGEAALAIEMMASPEDLAATIHPHPTISEGIREAAAILVGRPLQVTG
jgi:dihydrolipoamide dehydrogenase